MKRKLTILAIGLVAVAALTAVYIAAWQNGSIGQGTALVKEAQAAGGVVKDPAGTAPDRYVYYPGTEPLAKDEIRVIAAGTGMPSARRSQAATCFLVELGDGQKFLFDIGSGSHANLQLRRPGSGRQAQPDQQNGNPTHDGHVTTPVQ